ncbi:MAG: cobalamin-binding protein [Candidatus Omnitrophota bacterium]
MKKAILSIIFLFLFLNTAAASPRYISFAPSTTEILFALGLDDEIVGVSTFCNYPPKAQEKEKVGTFSQPNIEKILSLKPDIIFCTGLEQAGTVKELKQLNLKVYVSDPCDIEGLFNSIREIGRLTSKEKEADALIGKMKTAISEISSLVKLINKKDMPRVFVEIWYDPLMTAGKGSFIDELLRLAGGVNIAYDTPRPYSYFSPEQVLKRNPTCIILTYMSNEKPLMAVSRRFGWEEISAVKNNRIYNDINPDLLLRPGPRLVEGLKELHKRLYP